ncbi:DEAD/DEAH box helicase [Tetragenococcus muriaticus]|uniref:Putative ATPase n=2 Tax=Tetragenococcus muriaticus TaxID=64642 RepID=A0A091C095_9ENTE|nr:DEAD/DEAH box helicase family protein [Tetragenococcus muriaticus]KFN90359.1 putative ATPase [Tetragenococcus muriaticus 3MR10-3]GMA46791.1 DNA/RNA helicase [Tetragenococcus muriaticus]
MEALYGRQIVMTKEDQDTLDCTYQSRRGLFIDSKITCQRCGSHFSKEIARLPTQDYYCPYCIQFGRITSQSYLVSQEEKENPPRLVTFTWQEMLTPAQQEVSCNVLSNFQQHKHSLIWAVTGSGKTEMIFAVLRYCLQNGGRAAIASPRIDVCRELYPRINEVFPKENTLLLYGNSNEIYRYNALTICTTHQLFHFYHAFDLLIIDEIDAFPYEGDKRLAFAQKNALKKNGKYVYLSATPPTHLLRSLKETFCIEKLPVRFHKRPLVVPQLIWYENWKYCYQSNWKIKKFIFYLKKLLQDNNVLVFCPSIYYMQKLYTKVGEFFHSSEIECVSAQDKYREEKVQRMRKGEYRILFCTTILERGVTFDHISVIIMGANHNIFSKSVLVQIAGRVDRKGAYHYGQVLFFYNQQTQAIGEACDEIKRMNRLAKESLFV